jgi:hypothetical protein
VFAGGNIPPPVIFFLRLPVEGFEPSNIGS